MEDMTPQDSDTTTFVPLSIIPKEIPIRRVAFGTTSVASLLDISEATLRGWISRGQFPPRDYELNAKTPIWLLSTVLEYLRNAPGGRLPYQVG